MLIGRKRKTVDKNANASADRSEKVEEEREENEEKSEKI